MEEQQEKINVVRGLLGSLVAEMPSFLSDATIRRFLRASKWSTDHAAKSLRETVKWRREYKPDAIRWEDIADPGNEAKRAYIADYLDRDGRRVFVTKPAIKTKVSAKEHVKYFVYNLENLSMYSTDGQEEHVVWLTDFRGWAISTTPLSITRESIHIIQNHYPGMIAVAVLYSPPRIFQSFWKIAKRFLEPKMNDKVKFVYANSAESQKIMADIIDLEVLECAFGGSNDADRDIGRYAENMRRRDHLRGALAHAYGNDPDSRTQLVTAN